MRKSHHEVTQEYYDQKKKDAEKASQEIERGYLEYRARELAKSPYMRAQNINMFKIVHQAFTGKTEPPEELQQQAIKVQEIFFETHPKRIYCDPSIYRTLFTEIKACEPLLRLVESMVGQDIHRARSYKS